MRRNVMNGNASVERSSVRCHAPRGRRATCGPAIAQPDQPEAEDLEPHGPVGRQVVAEPARVVDLGRQRPEQVELPRPPACATVNSPTIRPASLSIAVSVIRPRAGIRAVSSDESQASAPGPVTRYLA